MTHETAKALQELQDLTAEYRRIQIELKPYHARITPLRYLNQDGQGVEIRYREQPSERIYQSICKIAMFYDRLETIDAKVAELKEKLNIV